MLPGALPKAEIYVTQTNDLPSLGRQITSLSTLRGRAS